jgi:plastocyanin
MSLLISAIGLAMPGLASASTAQTYTVLVGAENVAKKTNVMAYFPSTLHIHVGDTVIWKQNTHEIHTVTFLAGADMPILIVPTPANFTPAGIMLNSQVAFPAVPQGEMYDGLTYANSGVMSIDPGQPTQFSLTFTKQGSFPYVCVVHGMMMSGTIVVEASSVSVPSPSVISKQAQQAISSQLANSYALYGAALAKVPATQKNPDGSKNYTVLIGWSQGQYDLMDFIPNNLAVHPGDTVTFKLSPTNTEAPHTVTFLNGADDISFITPIPNPPGPPVLLINPQVLAPINPGQPLTRSGIYSSGLLNPLGPGPYEYTVKIGDVSGNISYVRVLHDTSGMEAILQVVPK